MLIASFQALAVALLAIVPGYIAMFFWSRNKMWRGLTNDLQTVLKALAISAVLQVILAPYTLLVLYPVRNSLENQPGALLVGSILLVLLLPYVAGTALGKAADWFEQATLSTAERNRRIRILSWLFPEATPPSVWDSIFSQDPADDSFVILEFKDGRRVAGAWGKNSEVYQSPEPHGIYLENEWTLDANGNIECPVPNSNGLMITDVSDLHCVRFLRGGSSERDETGAEARRDETGAEARRDETSAEARRDETGAPGVGGAQTENGNPARTPNPAAKEVSE